MGGWPDKKVSGYHKWSFLLSIIFNLLVALDMYVNFKNAFTTLREVSSISPASIIEIF